MKKIVPGSYVGSSAVLTTDAETSDGFSYATGEVGCVVAQAVESSTIVVLVAFHDARDPLTCTPGVDCKVMSA